MKKIFLTSALFISLISSPIFATETNINDHEEVNEEAIGLGIGSVVGGILGGPVGLITGAFMGALVGDTVGSDKEVQFLASDLKQSNATINTLQKNNTEQQQALKDANIVIEKLLAQNQDLKLNTLEIAVQFSTDSSEIEKHYQVQLSHLADILYNASGVEIEVDGFADRLGDESYNMELSGRRAAAVKDFLIQQGVDKERITAHAYGESKPIKPNESLENNFFDRRAAIRLQPIEAEKDSKLSVVSN